MKIKQLNKNMKNALFLLIFYCSNSLASAAWTPAHARLEAIAIVESIMAGQELLLIARQTMDGAEWERTVVTDFDRRLAAFRKQRFVFSNPSVEPFEECESALQFYKLYSGTFFLRNSLINQQVRKVNQEDFEREFSACKKVLKFSNGNK